MTRQEETARLMAFHAAHFPGQPTPKLRTTQQSAMEQTETAQAVVAVNDDLGYYEDGVKRTLTDAQIKLFRHSEIQRLLSERRAAIEKDCARKIIKEKSRGSSVTRETRKRRFHDEPSMDRPDVDSLMYDDPPENLSASSPAGKKFLWPMLGRQAA